MSLESINQKLRRIEKEGSALKFLFWCGFVPAIVSVAIIPILNPSYVTHYETPIAKIAVITMLTMAFMAMYVVLVAGGMVAGIMITWFLIKSRDQVYEKNGKVIGNSLSTNVKFLYDLAQGLFPHIIGFIKSYNDPKFEELEQKRQRENDEFQQARKEDMFVIQQQWKIIAKKDIKISELESKNANLEERVKSLEEWKSEQDQLISKTARTKNNDENTEINQDKKIEFLDE